MPEQNMMQQMMQSFSDANEGMETAIEMLERILRQAEETLEEMIQCKN